MLEVAGVVVQVVQVMEIPELLTMVAVGGVLMVQRTEAQGVMVLSLSVTQPPLQLI